MEDIGKTKEQLISEIEGLRRRVSDQEVELNDLNRVQEELEESVSLLNATLDSTADGTLIVDSVVKSIESFG